MPATALPLAETLRTHVDVRRGESLYAIVDAAQDKELAFEADERFQLPIRMLFQGAAAPYMCDVAPYFIPIAPQCEYLESFASRWGQSAGILLASRADPIKIFRHLRQIFVVKDEEGQEYFFRFYDPRVLRVYLPTCTPEETKTFFGPITRFLVEGSQPDILLRFGIAPEGLVQLAAKLPASALPESHKSIKLRTPGIPS